MAQMKILEEKMFAGKCVICGKGDVKLYVAETPQGALIADAEPSCGCHHSTAYWPDLFEMFERYRTARDKTMIAALKQARFEFTTEGQSQKNATLVMINEAIKLAEKDLK